MQVVTIFDSQMFYSQPDGSPRDTLSAAIGAALSAKTVELFLSITDVEDGAGPITTKVSVKWESSADGINWHGVGTFMDTGASKAEVKVYSGDNASELLGAYNRFIVTVEEFTATGALVYATASLKAVYKPF